jgi:signal transduction histidine kinase
MIEPGKSLGRRIARAHLLFALCASLFFALVAAVAVEGIEVHLVDNRLAEVAAWASPRHAGGLPVAMPAGLSFHHGDAIPAALRNLPPGTAEVHVDGIGLHVLSGKDALGNYVVVDHDSDYERIELAVYSMFALGFAGFMGLSFLHGRFMARGVVAPVMTLAKAVREGDAELPLIERDDELGLLARAFAAHTRELRSVLDRERFFTGDVSHELRTPLTVIAGAAEILAEQGTLYPAVAAPAERILRATGEAAACIDVLLALARSPDRSSYPLTDIGAVAVAETARYQHLLADRPVRMHCAADAGFQIAAPPELCTAIIGNLLRNAILYTKEGDIAVRLEQGVLTIDDTGPGLPPAVLAAFGTGAALPPSAGSAGSGLGLALVARLCTHLGATLALSASESGGSRFTIVFPTRGSSTPD